MIEWEKQEDGSLTCAAHAAIIYDRGPQTLPKHRKNSQKLMSYPSGRAANRNTHVVLRLGARYLPCVSFKEAKREAERLVTA